MTSKLSNPKDVIGTKKPAWFTYIPLRVLINVGIALLEGALKYSRHNYRPAGIRASVYMDACVSRHLTAWWEGEDIDPDSGLSHVDKAIASLVVLRDGMLEGNWTDDRPPRARNYTEMMIEAQQGVDELLAKYPNPKVPYTEKGKEWISMPSKSGPQSDGPPAQLTLTPPTINSAPFTSCPPDWVAKPVKS